MARAPPAFAAVTGAVIVNPLRLSVLSTEHHSSKRLCRPWTLTLRGLPEGFPVLPSRPEIHRDAKRTLICEMVISFRFIATAPAVIHLSAPGVGFAALAAAQSDPGLTRLGCNESILS